MCARNELEKLGGIKNGSLIEERYVDARDARGVDPGYKALQIFANTVEWKRIQSEEDRAALRCTAVSSWDGSRNWGMEIKGEVFEASHYGQKSEERRWCDIPTIRYCVDYKLNKISGQR
jgi:hypothetical protein